MRCELGNRTASGHRIARRQDITCGGGVFHIHIVSSYNDCATVGADGRAFFNSRCRGGGGVGFRCGARQNRIQCPGGEGTIGAEAIIGNIRTAPQPWPRQRWFW